MRCFCSWTLRCVRACLVAASDQVVHADGEVLGLLKACTPPPVNHLELQDLISAINTPPQLPGLIPNPLPCHTEAIAAHEAKIIKVEPKFPAVLTPAVMISLPAVSRSRSLQQGMQGSGGSLATDVVRVILISQAAVRALLARHGAAHRLHSHGGSWGPPSKRVARFVTPLVHCRDRLLRICTNMCSYTSTADQLHSTPLHLTV